MARFGSALAGLAIVLLIGAAHAAASTVQVRQIYDKAAYTGDRLVYVAAPGESNVVTIEQETRDTLTVTDSVPLTPTAGCEAISSMQVRCTLRGDASYGLSARLGDGDDTVDAIRFGAFYARLLGGAGDDHLAGPADATTVFEGGPGDDLMEGGYGWDIFREGTKPNGADMIVGGTARPDALIGDDTVDYTARRKPLRVSLDGAANDGEAHEGDNVGADVERVVGGLGADRLTGNGGANELSGGPGQDVLRGGAGDDHLLGDEYVRHPKHEGDLILGGYGEDRIEGGLGVDRMSGGPGHDSILSGAGDDRVNSRDDVLDAIVCGGGRDWVYHDPADFLNVECGRQAGPVPAQVVPLAWADDGNRIGLVLGCPYRRGHVCTADATLAVAGQTFGPRKFELQPGRYAWLLLPLGGRTAQNPDPPLDAGVVTLRQTDALGRVAVQSVPLAEVHREANLFSFFLPPVLPFL